MKDGGTKQIVLSLSKQHPDKQGWEAAELAGTASRGETTVATQSWCGSARRAPSDAHCWTRRIASCGPDCQLDLRWCTASQWNGRRDDPAILHDPLGALASGFITGRSLAENVLVGGSCVWCGDDALGTSCESKSNGLRGSCETRASRKLQQIPGRVVGRVWVTVFTGPDAVTDFLAGWEVITARTLSTRLQAHLDRESNGSANEHKTATRVWPGSSQAYCHAEKRDTKSRNSKMDAGFRTEKNRKRCSLPTDLGSSGRSASTTKNSGRQRTEKDNRSAGNIPAKQNSESEHFTHCDGPWRCSVNTRPSISIPTTEGDLGRSLLVQSQQR